MKLKTFTFVNIPTYVLFWIEDSRLRSLKKAYLTMRGSSLKYAFVERWHETNSFHTSLRYDHHVIRQSSLLKLPSIEKFFSPSDMSPDIAKHAYKCFYEKQWTELLLRLIKPGVFVLNYPKCVICIS